MEAAKDAGEGDVGEQEVYHGRVVPTDSAVVTKRVNARRQHSHHGRGNAGLVAGAAFKPLFVPYTEFISNAKKEMIKADAEDMAASLGAGSAESDGQM